MKTLSFICCLLPLLLLGTMDASPFYVSGFGGANFVEYSMTIYEQTVHTHSEYSTGYIVGGALGYRFCSNLSLEAEFAYRNNGFTYGLHGDDFQCSGHQVTGMGNVVLESIPVFGNRLYLGGGLGVSFWKNHLSTESPMVSIECESYCGHAYVFQAIAGIRLICLGPVETKVEYRYLNCVELGNGDHAVDLKLQYQL